MIGRAFRRVNTFDALILAGFVWFMGKFVRFAFPPLFATLGDSYGVSRTVLGLAYSAFMFVYALMQFPSGVLADRFGDVRVITAGSILTTVGALVLAIDLPFFVLAAAMVIMGAGSGTYKTVSVGLLSHVYPARTGRVLGIFDTIGAFGGVAAPAAVVLVVTLPPLIGAPWRTLFLCAGIVSVALTFAFAVRVPARLAERGARMDTTDDTSTERSDGVETVQLTDTPAHVKYLRLFRKPQFTGFVAVTVIFGFGYSGAVAFLPLYLTSETALSSVTANLLFSVLFVVSFVQILSGDASDRIGTAPVVTLMLAVAAIGLIIVLMFSDTGSLLLLSGGVVILGIGAHGFRPVRSVYIMELVPSTVAGGSLGLVRTMLMIANASAPALVGYLSESMGFTATFELLAGILVLGATLMVVLWMIDC